MSQPTQEVTYHITVTSKRGYVADDEDAYNLFNEKRDQISAEPGCSASLSRTWGGRGNNGVAPIISLTVPKASDPKKQIKPQQFFPAETDLVTCTYVTLPDAAPAAQAPAEVAPEGQAFAG